MTITRVRLVDDALGELVLLDHADFRHDLYLTGLDVRSPEVRAVTAGRTDTDGEDDQTALHGAAALSATVELRDHPAALVDQINAYLHPRRRPWLIVFDTEWAGERKLRLRADQWSSPIDHKAHLQRAQQLQWRVPAGVWEAVEATSFTVTAGAGELAGRSYPLRFPRLYPTTSAAGSFDHTNLGGTWAHWRGRLYGPCRGPRLSEDISGQTIGFVEDLVIPAGEYVEIDTRDRSAYYMSDPSLTRLNLIDFETTSWWQMAPGLNRVRYHPIGGVEIGCAADIDYHPYWLP